MHAGPFANIAHGNSSVVADEIALKLVGEDGLVLTEAGFGSDIGLEKFMNIKCRVGKLRPSCAIIVATVRALKTHGGGPPVAAGTPLAREYREENTELVAAGCENLRRHVRNAAAYNVPVVVAINRFGTDTDAELEIVKRHAMLGGATEAVVTNNWAEGGKGAKDLGEAVIRAAEKADLQKFKHTYELDQSIDTKIRAVAKQVYGASDVEYSEEAKEKIASFEMRGFGQLPVCFAKTQYSFSANPSIKGAPHGFTLPVRDVRLSAGAGFVYPLCGTIQTMPGLPTRPAYYDIDIDTETGKVIGLS